MLGTLARSEEQGFNDFIAEKRKIMIESKINELLGLDLASYSYF